MLLNDESTSAMANTVNLKTKILVRRTGFDPTPVHVRLVVDEVALGKAHLCVLGFLLSVSLH